ncbi:MAG: SRPBCC domain-containing protein [Cyclobacteriaceae bacterium]|nr:SRPBCC domain-containing protein [Cyclobacteriaceae bacterium]
MNSTLLFTFQVDREYKQIKVERSFNAPLDLVWAAWTQPDILDQWWAPKPWQAQTKTMDFREGGYWLYAMVGPNNEQHWARVDFIKIIPEKFFSAIDNFCDESGVINTALPASKWENNFIGNGNQTIVKILLSFDSLNDLEKIMAMGFKEGFTAGLQNLDQYIAAQFYLRKQNKPNNKARVCTYLNFDGKTEEAFLYYKSVFQTQFSGTGIQRFGEIPVQPGHPPVAEAVKKMVLHVELPITGGHLLMGTDSPSEMGFTLTKGNNMHISIEPETREEAKRLFEQLSAGGHVSMPLQDMFFGAYFGSCTDKYGINWIINFQSN